MLVLDTAGLERLTLGNARDRAAQQRKDDLEREIRSNTVSVATDAGRDTSSLLAQMGRPLASAEVQRRLHLCNPNLIFIVAPLHPELTGIYFERYEKAASGFYEKRRIHICGMETGVNPEFSVLHETVKRVPNPELLGKEVDREAVKWLEVPTFYAETRGWRTVLVRLLKAGIINRGDVEKHFGWTPSQESEKWHNLTA